MKVYVATSGEPGEHWYSILHAFKTREAAEAYELAHDVEEFDLLDAPPEVRDWHTVTRKFGKDQQPVHRVDRLDLHGDLDHVSTQIDRNHLDYHRPYQVIVQGWDLGRVQAAAEEECVKFLAERDEWAAAVVAGLDRIDVRAWYETDGRTVLQTPVHRTADYFSVPHNLVCEQAGIDPAQSLHGRWFTVHRLTFTDADGFSACEQPNHGALAGNRAVL